MSDLKLQPSSKPSSLLRHGAGPGHARTLHTANKIALHHLGLPVNTSGDPKGRVLRQLRVQLGIDPSLLATQACMSLSQLYQLEDGGTSRFYSESLRRQAGRRVAALLGADWDQMELHARGKLISSSNVVQLQRPLPSQPPSSPMPPEIIEIKVRHNMDQSAQLGSPLHSEVNGDLPHGRAVAMGLSSPATETVLMDPLVSTYPPTVVHQAEKGGSWSVGAVLLLVIVLGAAGGYAFAEYSPYPLYWPW
jgi:hypothetical protein